MSHDADLIDVDDMAEIPTAGHAHGKGGSKGVNLFLARQKLIADMMEQEEAEESAEGSTTRVYKPVAFGPGKENSKTTTEHHHQQKADTEKHKTTMSSSEGDHLISVEAMSEIPNSNQNPGSGRSKGANLFLARQKQIADMMAAEEEAEKAAEEERIRQEEEKRCQEELRIKQEAEEKKLEEKRRLEQEKLLESQRAKAAREARFRNSQRPPEPQPEPELPWVKKAANKPSASGAKSSGKTLYQLLSADKK